MNLRGCLSKKINDDGLEWILLPVDIEFAARDT